MQGGSEALAGFAVVGEIVARDFHITARRSVAHRGTRFDVVIRSARGVGIVCHVACVHVPGDPVSHAHFEESLRKVFPVVEHEVFQYVVFLFEVGEYVEMVCGKVCARGGGFGYDAHPFEQIFREPAARDVVPARVGVDGFSARESRIDLRFRRRCRRYASVRVFEVERREVDGILVVFLESVRVIVDSRKGVERAAHFGVFAFAHTHGHDVLRNFTVGAVKHEEPEVTAYLHIVTERVDAISVEEGGVVVVIESVFRHRDEVRVEVGDVYGCGRGRSYVTVGALRGVFGSKVGRPVFRGIDAEQRVVVYVGITQPGKDEGELRGSHDLGLIFAAVGSEIQFARSVVEVVVALNGKDLEIFVTVYRAHGVLQIPERIGYVDECDALSVFGQVARCEEIVRRNAGFRVGDESLRVRFQDSAAFYDEFGVTGRGMVKIAVRVIRAVRRVAMLLREVVDVAHLPERQRRGRLCRGKRAVCRRTHARQRKSKRKNEHKDQDCGRYGCRKPQLVFHGPSLS